MITAEKKLENALVELEIDVPVEKVDLEFKKVFADFQKNAVIDGFRKGKAPLPMIETRYLEPVSKEVGESLAKASFFDAVTEKQLTPIAAPKFDFEDARRGEPFHFKAIFEIPPTVELGKYKDISVEERVITVTDGDVQDEIMALRERFAAIAPKTEGVVEKGNFIKIQVKRIDNVEESERANIEYREYSMLVGKSKDPYTFDDHVIGMKLEEEKEVQIKYPKDYRVNEFAGQKVTFMVKVSELNTMDLPPFDDEFAQKVGATSAEELTARTKENLERFVNEKTRGEAKSKLLKEIVENTKFDIPTSLIINEMASLFQKTQQRIGYKVDSMDDLAAIMGMTTEDYRKKLLEEATQSVKTTLALSEIAKSESLKVSEEKYRDVLQRIAQRNNHSVEQIEEIIAKNNSRENIEYELVLDEAMDFIYDNGKVKKMKPVTFEEFLKLS